MVDQRRRDLLISSVPPVLISSDTEASSEKAVMSISAEDPVIIAISLKRRRCGLAAHISPQSQRSDS